MLAQKIALELFESEALNGREPNSGVAVQFRRSKRRATTASSGFAFNLDAIWAVSLILAGALIARDQPCVCEYRPRLSPCLRGCCAGNRAPRRCGRAPWRGIPPAGGHARPGALQLFFQGVALALDGGQPLCQRADGRAVLRFSHAEHARRTDAVLPPALVARRRAIGENPAAVERRRLRRPSLCCADDRSRHLHRQPTSAPTQRCRDETVRLWKRYSLDSMCHIDSAGGTPQERRANFRAVWQRGLAPAAGHNGAPHASQDRNLGLWPHRPQRAARHRRGRAQRPAGRRRQRPVLRQGQRASAALRQRARPLPGRGQGRRRQHRCRVRPHQGAGRARPQEAALEVARHRHRHGVHRHLHRQGEGRRPPRGRRQAGAGVGALEGRGPDRGLRRQPRQAEGRAQGGLQRLLHHQLPGAGGQGAERSGRHQVGLHDHDPRLHQRPEPARPWRTRTCAGRAPPPST